MSRRVAQLDRAAEIVQRANQALPKTMQCHEGGGMRATFHAELDELVTELAKMARRAAAMMTNASIALHQSDLALAGRVIADRDHMQVTLDDTEQHCVTLLALQAPVAADLRVVVGALHALGHLRRMGILARHVALIAQLKQPNPMASDEVRPVLARMSLLASQLAADAATAIEHQDPLSGCRLGEADDEVDALRCQLSGILFAQNWTHGVELERVPWIMGRGRGARF